MGHSHHHHHHEHLAELTAANASHRQLRHVAMAAIGVSLTLLIAKLWAWSVTDATSLLSSLADSLFDVIISWINFFAIRYAIKPADDDHRFGHQSIEDIAGLAQFSFICGSMVFVIAQGVIGLLHGHQVKAPEEGIAVMVLSLVLTSALVLYQRRVFKATRSLIVQADSLHYYTDLLMNISIIASLFAVYYWSIMWLDAALAIGIALYIITEAWEVGSRSFNNLMNKEMPDSEKEQILEQVNAAEGIRGYHNLKTRYSGSKPFIQMHVEIDQSISFAEAHEITERLEHALLSLYPTADIMLHQDPV